MTSRICMLTLLLGVFIVDVNTCADDQFELVNAMDETVCESCIDHCKEEYVREQDGKRKCLIFKQGIIPIGEFGCRFCEPSKRNCCRGDACEKANNPDLLKPCTCGHCDKDGICLEDLVLPTLRPIPPEQNCTASSVDAPYRVSPSHCSSRCMFETYYSKNTQMCESCPTYGCLICRDFENGTKPFFPETTMGFIPEDAKKSSSAGNYENPICLVCQTGFFRVFVAANHTYECVKRCPIGTGAFDNRECISCSPNCLECSINHYMCDKCAKGHGYAYKDGCVKKCPNRMFGHPGGWCLQCKNGCESCKSLHEQCECRSGWKRSDSFPSFANLTGDRVEELKFGCLDEAEETKPPTPNITTTTPMPLHILLYNTNYTDPNCDDRCDTCRTSRNKGECFKCKFFTLSARFITTCLFKCPPRFKANARRYCLPITKEAENKDMMMRGNNKTPPSNSISAIVLASVFFAGLLATIAVALADPFGRRDSDKCLSTSQLE